MLALPFDLIVGVVESHYPIPAYYSLLLDGEYIRQLIPVCAAMVISLLARFNSRLLVKLIYKPAVQELIG